MKETTAQVQVPRGTGIEGFLATMRKILRLPRVQWLQVDTRGTVRYSRVVREDEEAVPLEVDFDSLLPSTIIRGSEVQELEESSSASVAVCHMLDAATKETLFPIAFVTNPQTTLWAWFQSAGLLLSHQHGHLCGFPVHYDDAIPEYVLILCTGYHSAAGLPDTRKCFKVVMPEMHHLMEMSNG